MAAAKLSKAKLLNLSKSTSYVSLSRQEKFSVDLRHLVLPFQTWLYYGFKEILTSALFTHYQNEN